jgi:hypothetical protein
MVQQPCVRRRGTRHDIQAVTVTSNRAFRRLGVTLCGLCVLTGSAIAQERIYTNADLGKPIVRKVIATPEQLAALKAREFRLPPAYHGPIVIVVPSSREPDIRPFPWFPQTASLSSQGYDVIPPPFFAWPYGSVSGFSWHQGHTSSTFTPPPAPPAQLVRPAVVLAPASGSARVRQEH